MQPLRHVQVAVAVVTSRLRVVMLRERKELHSRSNFSFRCYPAPWTATSDAAASSITVERVLAGSTASCAPLIVVPRVGVP